MIDIKVHESGKIIHYYKPKVMSEKSLENIEKYRNKSRQYKLKGKNKRAIEDAAIRMYKEKKPNELLHFGTVTFSDDVPNEEKVRQAMYKKFVKNVSANYNVSGYIAVKEKGEKYGRLHYHIILRMPFVDYKKLNNCLNEIHKNFGFDGSNNLFTTNSKRRRNIIKNVEHVFRYVTKYVSKNNDTFEKRCYFISDSVKSDAIKVETLEKQHVIFESYPVQKTFICEQCVITIHDKSVYDAIS